MFKGWGKKGANHGIGLPRLRLPKVAAGRHPDARVRPREFRAWLTTIDDRNPLQSCKAILHQLRLLARFPGSIPKLPEILKLLDLPMSGFELHADGLIEGPQTEATIRATVQFLPAFDTLLTELGHLQKRMVNDLLDSSAGPSPAVLVSAMKTLAWQLRIDLTRYEHTPQELWRDMLQLYQVAEFSGATGVMVALDEDREQNVHDLFFGSLLFLLCDPLRLPPLTTWQLFAAAVRYAPTLELHAAKTQFPGIPVDATGNTPPLIFARQPRSSAHEQSEYLKIDRLIKTLNDAEADDVTGLLLRTVTELSTNRTTMTVRREERHRRIAEYRMFVGLIGIQRRLSQFSRAAPNRHDRAPAAPAPRYDPQAIPKHVICHQLDQSQHGAGFVLENGSSRSVLVGDLVLMETDSRRDATCSVGFVARVRRLLLRNDGLLEIGVEKLDGRLKPVNIKGYAHAEHGLLQQVGEDYRLIARIADVTVGATFELTDTSGGWRLTVRALQAQPDAFEPIPVERVA